MKKRKKLMIMVGIIVLLIIVCFRAEMALRIRIMLSCWEDYHNEFSLHTVYVDNEEKEISVSFKFQGMVSDENMELIGGLYREIYDIVYDNNKWRSYKLDININHTSQMPLFVMRDITKEKSDIEIMISFSGVSITNITELCPEVANLRMISLEYESLDEFDKFTNLKYVSFSGEYREYGVEKRILSQFPECEFSWRE